MRDPASGHVGGGPPVGVVNEGVAPGVSVRRLPMTYHEPTHSDSDESPTTDARYAAVTTEDGAVLYDRENESAWIESDTTCDREELI